MKWTMYDFYVIVTGSLMANTVTEFLRVIASLIARLV